MSAPILRADDPRRLSAARPLSGEVRNFAPGHQIPSPKSNLTADSLWLNLLLFLQHCVNSEYVWRQGGCNAAQNVVFYSCKPTFTGVRSTPEFCKNISVSHAEAFGSHSWRTDHSFAPLCGDFGYNWHPNGDTSTLTFDKQKNLKTERNVWFTWSNLFLAQRTVGNLIEWRACFLKCTSFSFRERPKVSPHLRNLHVERRSGNIVWLNWCKTGDMHLHKNTHELAPREDDIFCLNWAVHAVSISLVLDTRFKLRAWSVRDMDAESTQWLTSLSKIYIVNATLTVWHSTEGVKPSRSQ